MTDYIKFLMAAADEDTLRRVVSDSAISKLKPVLKANGVKGISKMKKADIVEAVISLVRARKKPQMSKYDAALNMICEASSISEVRQIIDKNFTVKELRNLGWAFFKKKDLPKSYIVEKHVILCIHEIKRRFLKLLQNVEPRVDIQRLFQLYLATDDLPDTLGELNELIFYKLNSVLSHISSLTGIKQNWDTVDVFALHRYLIDELKTKKAVEKQELSDEDFIAEYNMLSDMALPPQSEYMNTVVDKAQSLVEKAKTFNEQEDLLNTYDRPLIELLFARYTGQPAAHGVMKSLMIRAIMRLIEIRSPESLCDHHVGERVLEAKSKAERIAILQNSTLYGLYIFSELKHESLNPAPYISFDYESRRSIIEKCISRLKDD